MEQVVVELLVNNGVSGVLAVLIGMMLRSINQIKADFKAITEATNKKLYDPVTGKPHYQYASDCDKRMNELEQDIHGVESKVNNHESDIKTIKLNLNNMQRS